MTAFLRPLLLITICLLLFAGIVPGRDILDIASPAFKTYGDQNGLPSNSVMTMTRDRAGKLWVGTQDGAAYFNGFKWITINMPDRSISNYIFDLLPASDGSMWFATDGGGIHRLANGEWQTFTTSTGLLSNSTRVLLETIEEDGESAIWAGTREGLVKYKRGIWENIAIGPESARSRVRSLLATQEADGSATVWIGTYGGLLRKRGDELKVFDRTNGLPHDTVFSLYAHTAEDGVPEVLVGTDAGVAVVRGDEIKEFENTVPELRSGIRSITESAGTNGQKLLWIGTDGKGALVRRDGKWSVFNRSRGLPTDNVFSIVDAMIGDGSVWMATLGNGIARLEFGNWASVTDAHGMSNKIVFSIAELDGTLWFATFGNGLLGYKNGKWTSVDESAGLPSGFVYSLYRPAEPTAHGQLFAGTENGVIRFDGVRWSPPQRGLQLMNTETWGFLETTNKIAEGTLWVATSKGLAEIGPDTSVLHNTSNGLPDDRVRDVVVTETADGETIVWAATYSGGIARLQNGTWEVIDISRGLPSNRILSLAKFEIGGQQQLLAGTGGGIAVISPEDPSAPPRILSPETVPEMLNGYVLDLVVDTKDRLYALTNKGVTRFTGLDKPGQPVNAYTFTTEDGLPSNECVAGAGYFDGKRIFAGTVGGVGILDTSLETEAMAPKQVLMSSLEISGTPRSIDDKIGLTHHDNNIVIEYSLITDFRETSTRYRSQLVGLEDAPTAWVTDPHREFAYLPPGDYVFRVWARDHTGNIHESAPLTLTMLPAWWQTWWAMALYFLAIVAVVSLIAYAVYKNRLNRILAIEKVRARIAADLHDDIGANLSQISILSEVMKQKLAKDNEVETRPLVKIADTSRELMDSMSDIVWAINPQRDQLSDLIQRMRRFATEVFSAKDIEFSFNAPVNDNNIRINLETRREIHLVFKEAVNNCVRHSGCTRVDINISVDPQMIGVEIKDNGTGFDTNENSYGNGLASMRSRSESVGGNIEISSSPEGTLVRFSLPNRSTSGNLGRFFSFR